MGQCNEFFAKLALFFDVFLALLFGLDVSIKQSRANDFGFRLSVCCPGDERRETRVYHNVHPYRVRGD